MEKNLLKQNFFCKKSPYYKTLLFSTSLLAILISTPEKTLAEQKNLWDYSSPKKNISSEKVNETKVLKTFLKETLPEHLIKKIKKVKEEIDHQKRKVFLKGEIKELPEEHTQEKIQTSEENEQDSEKTFLKWETQTKGKIKDPELNLHIESQIKEDSSFQIDTQIGEEETKLTLSIEKIF